MTSPRIGILGGTFNPPHLAHLVCAQQAHAQLGLRRVLLVPTGTPPHKAIEPGGDPGAERRHELCRLAVAGDERFAVSRIELDRPGPSYTVDTLTALHDSHPEHELTLIVGGDMARTLPDWREPRRLLALARLAVAQRDGERGRELVARLAAIGAEPERIDFLEMPRIDISSSDIRDRIAHGAPIRYLVPDAVADLIERDGLYRSEVGA